VIGIVCLINPESINASAPPLISTTTLDNLTPQPPSTHTHTTHTSPYKKQPRPAEEAQEPHPISILLAPKGPALRLRETWVAECVGSAVARAGLSGAVLWASQEVKSLSGSVPFKLQVRVSGGRVSLGWWCAFRGTSVQLRRG